jgi:hypothetical protein
MDLVLVSPFLLQSTTVTDSSCASPSAGPCVNQVSAPPSLIQSTTGTNSTGRSPFAGPRVDQGGRVQDALGHGHTQQAVLTPLHRTQVRGAVESNTLCLCPVS